MSATSAPARVARASTRLDRVFAAVPVLAIALAIIVFYAVEAWTRHTPWVFTDEMEWTEISRAIEATGHAARRGQPIYFKSLYAIFIAPFWAIHSTGTAYAAIKYADVVLMSCAAIPTYLLARMLVAKRLAATVAVLSVCTPGMAYATSLEPEVLAYPFYTLASWLIVRALASGTRRDRALAVAACIVAGLVRWPQFGTVPASFAIAAAGLWVTGSRGKAVRRNWSRSDTLGAIVLLIGALFLFNRIVLQHVQEWQISTQYWENRMVDLGLRAALAFVVGVGILPLLGGLAALNIPERRGQPVYRAFAAYLGAAILCISLYTAVKAAFLSTVFATLWEERNMIYLAPLLLIGTAIVFESRRIDWRIVAAGSAFAVFLLYAKPLQLGYGYFEAPGFGILTIPNRLWHWTVQDLQFLMLVVLALSWVFLALRRRRGIGAIAFVLVAAWMLTSEIQSTRAFDIQANAIRANLPPRLDWVDYWTHDQPTTYLGQEIADSNGLLETEFWNRSLDRVDTLDGKGPGPGPIGTPSLASPDGTLTGTTSDHYVLADNGVVLQAPIVTQWTKPNVAHLVLYHVRGPWKLEDAQQQIYSDGWCPEWCGWTYFGPAKTGTLEIMIGRPGYKGDPGHKDNAPPAHIRLRIGPETLDPSQQPSFRKVDIVKYLVIRNGSQHVIRIHTTAPVRVEFATPIGQTFHPSRADQRNLSAQVGFTFVPDAH